MSDFERDDLEQRLREGLRRLEAPEGFAERVMARAEIKGRRRDVRAGWWRSVAAVLLLGVAAGGWLVQRERTERMEAREAREEFGVAMRVTARVTERSFLEAQRRISRTSE